MTEEEARDVQCWHYDDPTVRRATVHRFLWSWWFVRVTYFDGCQRTYFTHEYTCTHSGDRTYHKSLRRLS